MNNSQLNFDGTLISLIKGLVPDPLRERQREEVVKTVTKVLSRMPLKRGYSHLQVVPYGSFISKLNNYSSDIDLALCAHVELSAVPGLATHPDLLASYPSGLPSHLPTWRIPKEKLSHLLRKAYQYLVDHKVAGQAMFLVGQRMRVPVVKYVDSRYGIPCDMCLGHPATGFKASVLRLLSDIEPRFTELFRLVKLWAQAHWLNEPSRGTFNSWTLALLVIFLLQQPHINLLPPLYRLFQDERPNKADKRLMAENTFLPLEVLEKLQVVKERVPALAGWGRTNAITVPQLFRLFLEFYSREMTAAIEQSKSSKVSRCICTWFGEWQSRSWHTSYVFSVLDPFDADDNTARSAGSYDVGKQNRGPYIVSVLKESIKALRAAVDGVLPAYCYLFGPWGVTLLPDADLAQLGLPKSLKAQLLWHLRNHEFDRTSNMTRLEEIENQNFLDAFFQLLSLSSLKDAGQYVALLEEQKREFMSTRDKKAEVASTKAADPAGQESNKPVKQKEAGAAAGKKTQTGRQREGQPSKPATASGSHKATAHQLHNEQGTQPAGALKNAPICHTGPSLAKPEGGPPPKGPLQQSTAYSGGPPHDNPRSADTPEQLVGDILKLLDSKAKKTGPTKTAGAVEASGAPRSSSWPPQNPPPTPPGFAMYPILRRSGGSGQMEPLPLQPGQEVNNANGPPGFHTLLHIPQQGHLSLAYPPGITSGRPAGATLSQPAGPSQPPPSSTSGPNLTSASPSKRKTSISPRSADLPHILISNIPKEVLLQNVKGAAANLPGFVSVSFFSGADNLKDRERTAKVIFRTEEQARRALQKKTIKFSGGQYPLVDVLKLADTDHSHAPSARSRGEGGRTRREGSRDGFGGVKGERAIAHSCAHEEHSKANVPGLNGKAGEVHALMSTQSSVPAPKKVKDRKGVSYEPLGALDSTHVNRKARREQLQGQGNHTNNRLPLEWHPVAPSSPSASGGGEKSSGDPLSGKGVIVKDLPEGVPLDALGKEMERWGGIKKMVRQKSSGSSDTVTAVRVVYRSKLMAEKALQAQAVCVGPHTCPILSDTTNVSAASPHVNGVKGRMTDVRQRLARGTVLDVPGA